MKTNVVAVHLRSSELTLSELRGHPSPVGGVSSLTSLIRHLRLGVSEAWLANRSSPRTHWQPTFARLSFTASFGGQPSRES
jgi:hypothetical protein